MYGLRTTGDLATRALAVSRDLPWAVISHSTAAWLWGLDVLPPGVREHDWDVDILVPPELAVRDVPGIRMRRGDYAAADVLRTNGVRLTSPVRTAVDCAFTRSRYQALASLDTFVRAGVSRDHLRRQFNARAAGTPGRRQAAELLPLADPRVESPGESWVRLLVFDAGMPMPSPQVPVAFPDRTYYLDLGFVQYRTGVEYDGEEHHSSAASLDHDRGRRATIRAEGWELIVVRHNEIRAWPHDVVRSVYKALLIQGWRPPDTRRREIERNIRQIAARATLDQGLC